jgi:hypothetical protein
MRNLSTAMKQVDWNDRHSFRKNEKWEVLLKENGKF